MDVTPAPWQVAQLEVIPLWLYLLLVLKVALVLPIFESPVGIVAWQATQSSEAGLGTCAEPELMADVPVIDTGVKDPSKVCPLWQTAHAPVIPEWLNAELANVELFCTAAVILVAVLPTWHASQPSVPIGTWVLPGDLIGMAVVLYSAALAVLWHCTQLVVADGALACVSDLSGKVE
jgi:hypothetical protein